MVKIELKRLRAARKLIFDSSKWTQNKYACNISGTREDYFSKNAVSWCIMGACLKVCNSNGSNKSSMVHRRFIRALLHKSSMQLFKKGILYVNDQLGHREVIQVLDHAITSLSKRWSK